MNWFWKQLLFVPLGVSLLAFTANAQKPADCDCYHFPISTQCERRCGMTSGKITEVTNSTMVVTEKQSTSDNVSAKKTFKLGPATKKNGVLKQGAPVTVYYRREGNVAEQVDLVEALKGLLVPGDEPDPPLPTSCQAPVPPNALRVYLGGSSAGYSTSDEITVLTVKGNDILDVRRTSKGLAINAKTFSEDGKIIAEIVDNQFYINPNNFFRMDKPDSHSILVYDLRGRKVLDIRYINPHSVRVTGIFQVPGVAPVIIGESELTINTNLLSGNCFGGQKLIDVE
jgi:hypothetical protein